MLFSEFQRSKDKKYYKKETVFVSILGFVLFDTTRAKTDLNNKYMI